VFLSLPAFAQDKQDEGILRYRGMTQGAINGHRYIIVQAEVPGGRAVQLAIPNADENRNAANPIPELRDTFKSLKPGDLIRVTLQASSPMPLVRVVEPYEARPGEETPNGFVFKSSYEQPAGKLKTTMVELTKLGQQITVAVPTRRNEKGEMESDPDILAAVGLLKEGDAVWAQINGKTLVAIDLYKDPETGKLLKLGETDIDGHKVRSAEVDQNGKSITLLVPTRQSGRNFTPDVNVLRELQRLRPSTMVEFRTHEDGDKLWLREIQPAPKAPIDPKKRTEMMDKK
jgi:hypothetical protein